MGIVVADHDGWFIQYSMGLKRELGAGCPIGYVIDLGTDLSSYPSDAEVGMFLNDLAGWFRNSDSNNLLARLHPVIRGTYGDEQCRAFTASLQSEDLTIETISVGKPDLWRFTLDDANFVVNDTVSATARRSEGGTTTESVIHVASVGGQLRWFADCGDPLP